MDVFILLVGILAACYTLQRVESAPLIADYEAPRRKIFTADSVRVTDL